MTDTGEVVTFAELESRSNQGAQLFRSLGLRIGDCIAIYMENNARYLEICWAAQRAGLYYTCIATHLTAPEVAYILDDCDAQVFITSNAKVKVANALTLPPGLTCYMVGGAIEGYASWEEAFASQLSERIVDEMEGHDFLYSSGDDRAPQGGEDPFAGIQAGGGYSFHRPVGEDGW